MSEQDDKLLHDWVRQSLTTYRPDYDPSDWARVQRMLKRRRWWRRGAVGILALFILGLLRWLVLYPVTDKPATVTVPTDKPKQLVNSAPVRTESLVINKSIIRRSHAGRKTKLPFVAHSSGQHQWSALRITDIPFLRTSTTRIKPLSTRLTEQIHRSQPVAFSKEETAISRQMTDGDFGDDSTSYQILTRNLRRWPDAVIVCDLTSSMYPYTTQLFAWFKKNARHPSIKGIVFFTDCDSLGLQTRPGGPAGRMFVTRSWESTTALPMLLEAARNTVQNKDDAENDVAALLFAQQEFPDARHLILLADNISTVKDMALLNTVRKPVHVVLCGTTGSDTALAFQPDYYVIANQTNGSLHTLEDDFTPKTISRTTSIRVGSRYYRYVARKNRFKLTPFDHRPKQFLGFIWL
ncbi:hypothetical protein [Spirosoma endophyticum]|uniref:Uncharacterized protein n=1 Tax=Spirosoma endophyticum TaxID=662367 RepID=A0A1I1YP70_9BACT|nr:hypothetical protein [Spirosoma endophyticum]SFE21336.1 hypothetical protein SAMN05216167_111129 [Spirosoma endophyticum]